MSRPTPTPSELAADAAQASASSSPQPASRAAVIAVVAVAALLVMLLVIAARWSDHAQPREAVTATRIGHRINVNHADLDTLCLLRGIGPALARRIIDYRTQHGPFNSVEQLDNVKYIGPVTLDHIREHVEVE